MLLAPLILAEHAVKEWPAVVAIDSHALRVRDLHDTDDERAGKRRRGGLATGEVIVAMDYSQPPGTPMLLGVEGRKDNESWKSFLSRIGGKPPAFVVADRGAEIEKAVHDLWRDAVLYSCEGHLLRNAQDAATADGIPEWVPDPSVHSVDARPGGR